jgi:outer membrane protein OmpA-like peptidoglycan-associated protein
VRIDFPGQERLETGLREGCRVEVPGIYFDFNRATLNPLSKTALSEVAGLLTRQPGWRITIEGHTDNVGSDAYNQDLSTRRAAAVKEALIRDHGMDAGRLATAGFGESRPRETNETIAGRARNRRVELVRDCKKD